MAGAAFAVVLVTDPDRHYNEIDAGRTITHMQFTAWDRGIASCIFTGLDEAAYREFLGVPDDLDVTAVVGFGHPTFEIEDLQGRKDREPLEAIAYHGSFGEPLDLPE